MNENYVVVKLMDGIMPIAWSKPMTEKLANRKATANNLLYHNGYSSYHVWTVEKLKSIVKNPFEGIE